tara:strand:- start:317 stop:1042 length:726 start_codon:yes stop_codon:yes gene_type:complete
MNLVMPKLPAPFLDKWLPIVPGIKFYEQSGYFYNDQPISHRISEVIISKAEREDFQKMRNGEFGQTRRAVLLDAIARGLTAHEFLDHHHRGRSFNATPYQKLCANILTIDLWDEWEVVASEYMLVDLRRSIAGTCDMILRHKVEKDRYAIADLKTKSPAYKKDGSPKIPNKKNYSAQLGGYINLLNLTWPELKVEDCFVIYANDLMAEIHTYYGRNYYNYIDCIETYEGCRAAFFKEMEDI